MADIDTSVTHGFADSAGVKIHYASLGQGPLVVMIHGFPDFWYSWREQMAVLSEHYQTVAIDMRGYNLSDKPKGAASYDVGLLVADVGAVIRHLGQQRAIIVGHDWGGLVAWVFAMMQPDMTDKLVVLNLPHPRGLTRELANNPEQQKNSQYARDFQQEGAHTVLTAEALSEWVRDPAARVKYVEALRRSDFEAMLGYYKQNYPRPPYVADASPLVKVKSPVLLIHGLDDQYLLADALSGTWNWVATRPDARHCAWRRALRAAGRIGPGQPHHQELAR